MRHTGTITLETPRLILRRFAAGDAAAMYRNWASDPEVTGFSPGRRMRAWQSVNRSLRTGFTATMIPGSTSGPLFPAALGNPSAPSAS